MTEENQPPLADEPVGSVGEEAAKLFAALAGWAQAPNQGENAQAEGAAAGSQEPRSRSQGEQANAAGRFENHTHGPGSGGWAHLFAAVNDHIATGSQDCRYCPLCQLIGFVRSTSPEVKQQLASASASLAAALTALMAQQAAPPNGDPVEKINLDDAETSDEAW